MFNSLHTMFMDQYTEQWTALDETAERIRALGFNAPGSYAEFIKLTTIKEEPGLTEAPDWREMVHQLVVGNRSEEHTSELQSLMRISYAVFCLKQKIKNSHM